ncbi:ABC transporter permease [Streptantibioticus silvisoli]|uniref:ABC transporter permease n=1 Tax=Streptantibioticus silvisoli TaxID=2705255 RepID=A0ABT6W139_9ACTN|nr:ABC transporter permease [Streptantibioticus silvisoli]MDI5964445.1 ABC transporter permease [Streptantibioticus silvisoli]
MKRRTLRSAWHSFTGSPYFPATVIVFIVAVAAGLFAGSYTYAMANPTPRHIPTAVTGAPASQLKRAAFVAGMERALGASLDLEPFTTYARAHEAVEEQRVFAILQQHGGRPELDVSSASGASVAELLTQAAPAVGARIGAPAVVRDINPVQKGDPRGLAIFYISLASVVVGFVGSTQLAVNAKALPPGRRIAFTAAYALLGGFAIAAVVDWGLGALRLPFAESWLILAMTMFTSGMVFAMFSVLIGRWALLPTWGLMVLLGNPSSGGAVSWPLLPSLLGAIGRWLPPGAAVNAQHTAVYFGGHQHAFPFLVLAAWAVVASTVFWLRRDRATAKDGRGAAGAGAGASAGAGA